MKPVFLNTGSGLVPVRLTSFYSQIANRITLVAGVTKEHWADFPKGTEFTAPPEEIVCKTGAATHHPLSPYSIAVRCGIDQALEEEVTP